MGNLRTIRKPTLGELERDPLLAAIEKLVDASPDSIWCGRFDELLKALDDFAPETVRRNLEFWPHHHRTLARRLNLMDAGLEARNIVVVRRKSSTSSLCLFRGSVAASPAAAVAA